MKYGKLVNIPAVVGMASLVGMGFNNEYPMSFGNYFSFYIRKEFPFGPRCINMWSENMKEASTRFLDDGLVQGYLFEKDDREWFVVCDPRIPNGWTNKDPYFVGYGIPTEDVMSEIMVALHESNNL